ncbi:ABC transporter ATP-binding protein [Gracilibacillus timonensis]|uniref:ABC transporter ATP-binding protein n=1 Tax=Gracilibacillus timonensis TaxID=1816696 RepID=UPI000ADF6A55|nr:ABC transporter ATP-binding protein [Gracilibacillus timonensis]
MKHTWKKAYNIKYIISGLTLLWKADKKRFLLVFFISLCEALMAPALLVISKVIIDELTLSGQNATNDLFYILMVAILFVFLNLLIETFKPLLEMQTKLLTANFTGYIDQLLMQKANELTTIEPFEQSRFHSQLKVFRNHASSTSLWMDLIIQIFSSVISIITISLLIWNIIPWIPAVLVIISLPKLFIEAKLNNVLYEGREEVQEKRRRAEYLMDQPLNPSLAHEMKLFHLTPFFQRRYYKASHNLIRLLATDQKKWANHRLIWGIAEAAVIGLLLLFLLYRSVDTNEITPGDVALFITALFHLNGGINNMFGVFAIGVRELLQMKQLILFLQHQADHSKLSKQPTTDSWKEGFEIKNLQFSYDQALQVLDIKNMKIPKGKITALVGENGAGKTSLVHLLCKFYKPDHGAIFLNGVKLEDYDTVELRKKFTAVFQNFNRYELSLKENIALGNTDFADDQVIQEAIKASGADSIVQHFNGDIDTPLGKLFGGQEISQGQWQRIALARAFTRLKQAEIVILDEPTSALDAKMEREIYTKMEKLAVGKTVILISHRLTTVSMADNIIFLEKGRVVEQGTHLDLLKLGGKYAEVFHLQSSSYQEE